MGNTTMALVEDGQLPRSSQLDMGNFPSTGPGGHEYPRLYYHALCPNAYVLSYGILEAIMIFLTSPASTTDKDAKCLSVVRRFG